MAARDRPAQGLGQRPVHRPGLHRQHGGVVEAAHLQHMLDRLTGAVDGETSVGFAGHRSHGPVDVRRGGAVVGQFPVQGPMAQLRRAIVEIA